MKVLAARPRGFCAGVQMAVEALERAVELLGTPLYVYHQIVHNEHVVERFRRRGVQFVDSLEQVPAGANLVYSAHGVSPQVRSEAAARTLHAIDATCPLVAKVHLEARRLADAGYTVLLIGHRGHDEVAGIMGEAPERILLVETVADAQRVVVPEPRRVAFLTQTTLSTDDAARIIGALRRRFPHIQGPPKEDICYATQNRQQAVRELCCQAELVLVVGSPTSSNSVRLTEVARNQGRPARLIDGPDQLDPAWFHAVETVLLTAGASTPEDVFQECVHWFEQRFGAEIHELAVCDEQVRFPLPRQLRAVVEGTGPTGPRR